MATEIGVVWKASDTDSAEYVGVIEFQSKDEEYHTFEILSLPDRLLFGGMCNVGFLESGYILKDELPDDEVLRELLADLAVYYNDGQEYTSMIVCNKRM